MDGGYGGFVEDDAPESAEARKRRRLEVRVVRNMEDMFRVATIRASVYMAEQNCPYEEEFDGNDFSATHMIGYVDGEPAACLRIRYFAGFAKLERVAVRHGLRKSRIAFRMIRAAIEFCGRKGFDRIYGHARDELVPLWRMYGFKELEPRRPVVFSDFSYTEMVRDGTPVDNAISLDSDPNVLIRPEGEWDRPSVLEISAAREASREIRDLAAAAA